MEDPVNGGMASIWTVSSLMAVGYLAAVLPPTAIDPLLVHHVRFGARHYRWGWWIALGAIPILLCTLAGMRLSEGSWRVAWSAIPLAASMGFLLTYFKPEVPHGSVTTWIPAFVVLGLLASWFRFGGTAIEHSLEHIQSVDLRRDLAKELLVHWRTVAIALSAGYLALLISWFSFMWSLAPKFTPDAGEQFVLGMAAQLCLAVYSVCVVIGPVREAWAKVDRVLDLFKAVGG